MSSAATRTAIDALGDAPFTARMAEQFGLSAGMLRQAAAEGSIRRLLWGTYVAASTPVTRRVRASAARLLVPPGRVLTRAGASWVHGVLPCDPYGRGAVVRPTSVDLSLRKATDVPGDVVAVGELLVTSPDRTALDLAGTANRAHAVVVLDAFLRAGLVAHRSLSTRAGMWRDERVRDRLRGAVALSDGRSSGTAETVLRLGWREAELPTPVPGLVHHGIRRSLALPVQRFTVTVTGGAAPPAVPGWLDLTIAPDRVLPAVQPEVVENLRREFHEHLLRRATWLESAVWSSRHPIR